MQELVYNRPDGTEKMLLCAGERVFTITDIARYETTRGTHCRDCRRDVKNQKKHARKKGRGWVFEGNVYKWGELMQLKCEHDDLAQN
jgi:hypothetical protein